MTVAKPRVPPEPIHFVLERIRRLLATLHRRMVPAPVVVMELMEGAWVSQAVFAAAELGIADALVPEPLSLEALATRVGSQPDPLKRLMRLLVSKGLFVRQPDNNFALTALGSALRSDADPAVRPLVRWIGAPRHREHWSHIVDAVRHNEPVVPTLRGMSLFEFLHQDRELGEVFDAAMTSSSELAMRPLLAAHDFTQYSVIVDIGGGQGRLLSEILAYAPESRGVLFDLPDVVADVPKRLRQLSLTDRCIVVGGSFLDEIPAGGDAYILRYILHDWPEDKALHILRTVCRAMSSSARLLVIENVLPDDDRNSFANLTDLEMLISVGGRERTEKEYRQLLYTAGLDLIRRTSTAGPNSILEARILIN